MSSPYVEGEVFSDDNEPFTLLKFSCPQKLSKQILRRLIKNKSFDRCKWNVSADDKGCCIAPGPSVEIYQSEIEFKKKNYWLIGEKLG